MITQSYANTKPYFIFFVPNGNQTSKIVYEKEPPAYLPKEYGSYHQLYRVNGKLIAIAVLDILPSCVSSVYFMYDNAWEKFSLGKVCRNDSPLKL